MGTDPLVSGWIFAVASKELAGTLADRAALAVVPGSQPVTPTEDAKSVRS
jgi:hypothetical protein